MNNYAFIDSQNLYFSMKFQGRTIDYKRFRIFLRDKFGVSKAFMFIGYLPDKQKLYTSLQEAGFILIFKPTLQLKNGKVKGNVDGELILHTMIERNSFDRAVIVSGDGDFHCLIEHLQEYKKLAYILLPNKYKYSSLLKKYHHYFRYITDYKQKLIQRNSTIKK